VRKKSSAVLNFAHFNLLVCIVTRLQDKSRLLALVPLIACSRFHLQVYVEDFLILVFQPEI